MRLVNRRNLPVPVVPERKAFQPDETDVVQVGTEGWWIDDDAPKGKKMAQLMDEEMTTWGIHDRWDDTDDDVVDERAWK